MQARSFGDVYGNSFAPNVGLFYEYQPFHSEWFGNFGILLNAEVAFFNGNGLFAEAPPNPIPGGQPFPEQSHTKFQFFAMPITVALDYRFNLLRVVRPYVSIGPTAIGYFELRNDDVAGHHGDAKAITMTGGASILLDWISDDLRWDAYSQNGIKHSYLNVQYTQYASIASDVSFNVSGIGVGLMFEY